MIDRKAVREKAATLYCLVATIILFGLLVLDLTLWFGGYL